MIIDELELREDFIEGLCEHLEIETEDLVKYIDEADLISELEECISEMFNAESEVIWKVGERLRNRGVIK